jgi:hypothetical protein
LSPVETATKVSPSKSQKTKRKLEFGKNAEDQGKATATNVLNLPYSDSNPEPLAEEVDTQPLVVEMETLEQGISGTSSK